MLSGYFTLDNFRCDHISVQLVELENERILLFIVTAWQEVEGNKTKIVDLLKACLFFNAGLTET